MNSTPKKSFLTSLLLLSLLSLRQMDEAWAKVRGNGGCAGGENISITMFTPGAPRTLAEISDRLRRGKYRTGPYRVVKIGGGKQRLIAWLS